MMANTESVSTVPTPCHQSTPELSERADAPVAESESGKETTDTLDEKRAPAGALVRNCLHLPRATRLGHSVWYISCEAEGADQPESNGEDAQIAPSPALPLVHARISQCRTWQGRRYRPARDSERRNDLLFGVGFLELANALDFAANIWNEIPPPRAAVILMAIGGTIALGISTFAVWDCVRSYRNTRLLLRERSSLRKEVSTIKSRRPPVHSPANLECLVYWDINNRELGTELIDRIGMDCLLGFGAVLVGLGTYLAIAGANPRAYLASNLMTGYIGNVPPALYGLANAAWSIYAWRRARRQIRGADSIKLQSHKHRAAFDMLRRHTRHVQVHAVMNGCVGLVGGVGSMMTASTTYNSTMVWGYIVLLPCIISAAVTNYFWRYKIHYDRDLSKLQSLSREGLIDDIYLVALHLALLQDLRRSGASQRKIVGLDSLSQYVNGYISVFRDPPLSLDSLDLRTLEMPADKEAQGGAKPTHRLAGDILYIAVCGDFFSDICAKLGDRLGGEPLGASRLDSGYGESILVDSHGLWRKLQEDEIATSDLLEVARDVLVTTGLAKQQSEKRRLLELLGSCATRGVA
jgi:hypothetical protein